MQHIITLDPLDTHGLLAAVEELEKEAQRALETDSYNMDYTEVAGAILTLSRKASAISGQIETQ